MFAPAAWAATMAFAPLRIASGVQLDVWLKPEGALVNAVEGKLDFPADTLHLQAIEDGDSIVTLWVESPRVVEHLPNIATVEFSGIIPGGFAGDATGGANRGAAKIFSLIFLPPAPGTAPVRLHDARVYLNDGRGTRLAVADAEVQIGAAGALAQEPSLLQRDTTPPESFSPILTRDPQVFGGNWALVFVAHDKGAGIDHYEVAETRRAVGDYDGLLWKPATSPYRLEDQSLLSAVYVKAVDRAGNVRIAPVPISRPLPKAPNIAVTVLLLALLAALLLLFRISRPKNLTSHA